MKIAVDARELVGRKTGVGRYLGELLVEWAQSSDALRHHWTLYTPQSLSVPPPFANSVRVLHGRGGTTWEQWQLSRAVASDEPDVLFAPAYTAPLNCRCPIVLTIHDVSFAAHPEWFQLREGARRRTLTRLSARRAQVILTDTEFSRAEIVRHLDVAPQKVHVIPLGVRQIASLGGARRGSRASLILFVGSLFTRRHVDDLIRAFATHVARDVPESVLEIVGEDRSHPPVQVHRLLALQSPEVQRRIAIRSYVDDETLRDLYARATLFVFPSEYEGFGLTPLEAMAAGVAPVVLDTPVAREVYGAAAHYVPHVAALDQRLGETLVHLLSDDAAREDLFRRAPAVLQRYDWRQTAATTLARLEEAGGV